MVSRISGRAALLGCAGGLALGWSSLAAAQVAPPSTGGATTLTAADAVGAEIVITGSRVRGVAPVGSPVISLSRDDITASGAVTIDRLIKEIPQVFDLGVSENSRGQSGGAGNIVYGNTINLRGIGPYATLVLIDGHRVTSNTRSIDPSVLPSLGVQRIEVVADGASAIYGSDAVAGVVNIIPRRTLNGAEVAGRYGISDDGKFDEYQAGFAVGKTWDSGQIMVAYEHVYRSALNGNDRNFFVSDQTAFGGRDYRVTRCNPGTLKIGTTSYAIPAAGLTQANADSIVAGTSNKCNDLIGQDLIPQQKYDSANFTFTQDVSDWLTIFADGFYSKRDYIRQPAFASAVLAVPQTNAFFARPTGFTGTSYTIDYNFMRDIPRNTQTGYARSYEVTPGFRIHLPHDWQFEGLFTGGQTNDTANQTIGVNNAALNAALASNNPATAFDPYGLGRTSAATLAGIGNQIFIAPTDGKFKGYEARLNGALFNLPGGAVKVALGYEGQKIDVAFGSARGNPTVLVAYRAFSRSVDSVYGEVIVPLFGRDNAVPGFERLEIDAAVRFDRYSDVGKTTNPKFGVNWSPLHGLTLRGSYGTSFRAPILAQIYGNSNNLFGQSYQNPAGGAPLPGFALSGQNLGLKPETATTWSAGADWEPLPNLRLSATYFNVKYKNQVDSYLSDLTILSRESLFDGTGIILRGTAARDRVLQLLSQGVTLASGSFPGGDPNNVNLFVDGRSNNLSLSLTHGIDFQGSYRLETARAGTFTLNAGGTYLTKFATAITVNAPVLDRRNLIFNPLKFKARGSLTWDYDPVRAQVTVTHVGGYTNNAVTPFESVKSYTPVDFSLAWTVGGKGATGLLAGLTIGGEVRNAFNASPPYVNLAPSGNGSGGYDASAASPIGRVYAASVRKIF